MSNLVIVAIPAEDDDVWNVSSERKPHLTICFLGNAETNPNAPKIGEYVKEQANRLAPFNLRVDHRGVLGSDSADVLFFSEDVPWMVVDFRESLLADMNIRSAYNSIPQHTKWSPHLTLGYPETPAKKDNWDPMGTIYVKFDKIGVWFSEYGGIEIPLTDKTPKMSMVEDSAAWSHNVDDILTHHGIKGMKWGVRSKTPTAEVSVRQKGKKLKTSGGKGLPAHEHAVAARTIGQKGKASGLHALSNEELQAYSTRLNLEQNVKRLQQNEQTGPKAYIGKLLKKNGDQAVNQAANRVTTKKVDQFMSKKGY